MVDGLRRPLGTDRRTVLSGLGFGLALAVAACSDAQVAPDDQGRVRLRLALDTLAGAEHGGYYQALTSGAYARRGLVVEILRDGGEVPLGQRLASGSAELGVAGDSTVPITLVEADAPVRAVAAFFQRAPVAVFLRPDPAVTGLADLAGRPILITPEDVAVLWPWLRERHGLTDDQLRVAPPDPAAFDATPGAALIGRSLRDLPALASEGRDIQTFDLTQDGWPAYGSVVVAPNGFARDNAAPLRAFIAASIEGWRDYLRGDPTAADARMRIDNPALDPSHLAEARRLLIDSGTIDGGDAALYGLGTMTAERWDAIGQALALADPSARAPDVGDAFTTAYLPGRR